jgi:arsenate reductase
MNKEKVLFICTSNSARSQIAEGLLRSFFGDKYEVYSAGINPTTINPYAIEVMKEIGIDISSQRSKNIEEFRNQKFDYVVTVCDNSNEVCPFFPGKNIIHKGFYDPSEVKGNIAEKLNTFRNVRDQIKEWIEETFENN